MAVLNDFAVGYHNATVDRRNKLGDYSIKMKRGPIELVIEWPLPANIGYGQTVGSALLEGGIARTSWGTEVSGVFSWQSPSTVLNAGTHYPVAIFTPDNPRRFAIAEAGVRVIVEKTIPTVSSWPTAAGITYGQTLSASALSGGSGSVPGTFAWTDGSTVPTAGTASHSVSFIPTDSDNYETITSDRSIVVAKQTPTLTWPTANQITYGQALSSATWQTAGSAKNHANATVAGTFAWVNPGQIPNHSIDYSARFTPDDTVNYNTITAGISVLVRKTFDSGMIAKLNGQTTVIDLTAATVISARVRWQGWQKTTSTTQTGYSMDFKDGLRSGGSYSATTVPPAPPSGWVMDYIRVSSALVAANGGTYGQCCVPGLCDTASSQYLALRATITKYNYGSSTHTFYKPSNRGYAWQASAATYYSKTTYYVYQTENPAISIPGESKTHWGTLGNGVLTAWQNITNLQSGVANTVGHSVGGSNQTYVQLEVTYYTTG
jgi:hypothetical protein